MKSQGKGVSYFGKNPVSNCWLRREALLPGEEIDLLKMRTKTFLTKESLRRIDPQVDPICRKCKAKIEILGHNLGEFHAGKGPRIERHDSIVDRIEKKAQEGAYTIAREKMFESGRTLRPDLVIKIQGKTWVVDVTVRFEQGDSLTQASREKKQV